MEGDETDLEIDEIDVFVYSLEEEETLSIYLGNPDYSFLDIDE